jgi:LysM repeat protein
MRKAPGAICLFSVLLFFLCGYAHSSVSHKVKSGKTLKKTSRKHRVSVDSRKETGRLTSTTAKRGRVLMVAQERAGTSRAKTARSRRTTAREARRLAALLAQAVEDEGSNEYIEYRVKRGDTLDTLAQRFNIDREELIDLNKVEKRRLKPGMTVFVPKTEEEGTEETVVLNARPLKPWKSEEERGILVKVAKSFAGAPYRYGGDSVRGLDCSAFVKKMYEIFEVQLPRSAREQFCAGPQVNKEDLSTGDLVFFKTKRFAKCPTHVGIYIGDQKFIHASSLFGRGVKIDRLTDTYFTRTYAGAVRVKAPPSTDGTEMEQNQRRAADNG